MVTRLDLHEHLVTLAVLAGEMTGIYMWGWYKTTLLGYVFLYTIGVQIV